MKYILINPPATAGYISYVPYSCWNNFCIFIADANGESKPKPRNCNVVLQIYYITNNQLYLLFIVVHANIPTQKAVFDLMKFHSARWDEFARELKISYNYRNILRDEHRSAEARLEDIINKWIESECSPVTWDCLINVLKTMGLQRVIHEIEGNDHCIIM